mmetsp:Transcript_36033/g.101454  ORF Transcript_36033/g.101454 Transcript_36033/m.101454 type:complete len:359 (+) Transcript_36033:138-1214(+)
MLRNLSLGQERAWCRRHPAEKKQSDSSPPAATATAVKLEQVPAPEGAKQEVPNRHDHFCIYDSLTYADEARRTHARTLMVHQALESLKTRSPVAVQETSNVEQEIFKLSRWVEDHYIRHSMPDNAINLLLETPPENPNYLVDGLKACVVAAAVSPNEFHNTCHVIAVNHIAAGRISEGIQLLCITKRHYEACMYLQTSGLWTEAASLAACCLSGSQRREVMMKWARHLKTKKKYRKATMLALQEGQLDEVLHLLFDRQKCDVASLFYCAIVQRGLKDRVESLYDAQPETYKNSTIPLPQLLEAIHLDYGNYLYQIGAVRHAQWYFQKSGHAGFQMIESIRGQQSIVAHQEAMKKSHQK